MNEEERNLVNEKCIQNIIYNSNRLTLEYGDFEWNIPNTRLTKLSTGTLLARSNLNVREESCRLGQGYQPTGFVWQNVRAYLTISSVDGTLLTCFTDLTRC